MNVNTYRNANATFKLLFAISLVISLSAFRHTDVEGYTDPDFVGYKFTNVVLQMPNATLDFERRVVKLLVKKLGKKGVRIFLHDDLFPPTREWDEEKSAEIYKRHNIDAGIIITVGTTESETTPGMMMYHTTTIGSTTTGHVNQFTFSRDATSFGIAIVDAQSRRTVWLGRLDTRGAGLLFIGNKSTAKGLVKGLLKEWKTAGHLR